MNSGAAHVTTRAKAGRQSLARNTLLNLAGQAIPLIVAALAIPFIIRGLGTARFGILSLIATVVGYAGVFDLGLGRATTKRVAEALGRGDHALIPAIAWTAIAGQLLMGAIGGLVLVGIAPFLAARLLNVPSELVPEATASFRILALEVPAILVLSSLRGVLEASQRFDLVNLVKAPLAASNFLVPLIGVLLGWKLPAIVVSLVAVTFLGTYAYYRACGIVFDRFRAGIRFHRTEFRELLGFGSWVAISGVLGPVLVYADRVLLGAVISIAAVGLYAAPYEMITRTWIVASSLVATLFPAFATLGVGGEPRELRNMVSRSMTFLLVVVGPIAMVVIALAPQLLAAWLGPEYARESATALRILAAGVLLNSFALVPYALIQALNRPDITAKLHLLQLPLHLFVAWILIHTWAIPGAALAWSARVALEAIVLFVIAERRFHLPLRTIVTSRILLGFGILALGSGGLAAVFAEFASGATSIAGGVLILGVVGLALWTWVLTPAERAQVLGLRRSRRSSAT